MVGGGAGQDHGVFETFGHLHAACQPVSDTSCWGTCRLCYTQSAPAPVGCVGGYRRQAKHRNKARRQANGVSVAEFALCV
jgi:hypothetical protein